MINSEIKTNKKLTVLIPTKNRKIFVDRLLNYLKNYLLDIDIIIGDSSDFKQNYNPNFKHIKYSPDIDFYFKIEQMSNLVKTKYLIICSDDDFIIIENIINHIIPFLENNNYGCVYGMQIGFNLDDDNFRYILSDYFYSIEDDNEMDRFDKIKRSYIPLILGIYRTDVAKEAFKHTGEISIAYKTIRLTKFKVFDRLTHVRQIWPGSDSAKENKTIKKTIIGDISIFMRKNNIPVELIYLPKIYKDLKYIKEIEACCNIKTIW